MSLVDDRAEAAHNSRDDNSDVVGFNDVGSPSIVTGASMIKYSGKARKANTNDDASGKKK